jgi:peptidylprolyl isomerase
MHGRNRNRLIIVSLLLAGLAGASNLSAQEDMIWRNIDPDNTVYMELDEGTVIFELNPRFAPKTVKQFKHLVEAGFYRGLSFYRVIDGFVAQAGDESDIESPNAQPALEAEFEHQWDDDIPWSSVESGDMFGGETGFVDGFAAARAKNRVWLTHCPGVLAMARNTDPDSGSTDFYIVIGQAPRYLDRNLTIFGRVVHGMDVVQRIRRGPVDRNGIIVQDTSRTRILNMLMSADIDESTRKSIYVMDTGSRGFRDYMRSRRNRSDGFFHHKPPKVLDVCQVPVGTRVEKPDSVNRSPARSE